MIVQIQKYTFLIIIIVCITSEINSFNASNGPAIGVATPTVAASEAISKPYKSSIPPLHNFLSNTNLPVRFLFFVFYTE